MKLSNKEESKTKRVLVYGPPKTGKTLLVGSLATHFQTIDWFDLESGVETLFRLPKELQEKINVFSIPDTRSVPMAVETMLKVIKGLPCDICHAHGKVSCPICKKLAGYDNGNHTDHICLKDDRKNKLLVVDSISQLVNSAIANITRGMPDDYKLKTDDWGNLGKIMDMFLSHVQNASYDVVCISHDMLVETNDGKEKIVPIGGTRNFSRNVAKYFGDVVYCEIENKKHKFASGTTYKNLITTGSRSDVKLEDIKKEHIDLYELWESK